MSEGRGTPSFELSGSIFGGSTSTPAGAPPIVKYKMDRFKIELWGTGISYYGDYVGNWDYFELLRYLNVDGANYGVNGQFWYTHSTEVDKKTDTWKINGLAWNSTTYNLSTSGSQNADDVIAALMSEGSTASFLTQDWRDYQYEKTGTTIKPGKFESVIVSLWNKYCVKIFPRDRGNILFQSKITGTEATARALSLPLGMSKEKRKFFSYNSGSIIKRAPFWNIFSEDETGATHRLSATYPELANYPLKNVGFLPSTASAAYIKELLSEPPHHSYPTNEYILREYTIRPNFSIEQGDFIQTDEGYMIANVEETFNIPGTVYPWQMIVKGEPMGYEGGTL